MIMYPGLNLQSEQVFKNGDDWFILFATDIDKKSGIKRFICNHYNYITKETQYSTKCPIFTESELSKAIIDGEASLENPYEEQMTGKVISEAQMNDQRRKIAYITEVFKQSKGNQPQSEIYIQEAIKQVDWKEFGHKPPGSSTLKGWVKSFITSGKNPQSLIGWGNISDKGRSRLPEVIEDLMLKFIVDHYLVKVSLSVNHIYDLMSEEFNELHARNPGLYVKKPGRATFYNRINDLSELTSAEAKLSKSEVNKLKRIALKKYQVSGILARVEIDAIHISLGILDESGKKYAGTIVLMVAIDVFSRSILGYDFIVDRKSAETADLTIQCIKHAISQKDNEGWPMRGTIRLLVNDASTAATSDAFKIVCSSLGINTLTTTVGEPWRKPFIERFFLTLRREFLAGLPGYLGSKIFRNHDHLDKGDNVKDKAQLTEKEFRRLFEDYIVNNYHHSGHTGLNDACPHDVWVNEVKINPLQIHAPVSEIIGLNIYGLCKRDRTLNLVMGVCIDKEYYNSENLKQWSNRGIELVDVYYSNIDTEFVVAKNSKNEFLSVPRTSEYDIESTQRSAINLIRQSPVSGQSIKGRSRPDSTKIEPLFKTLKQQPTEAAKQAKKPSKIDNSQATDMTFHSDTSNLQASVDSLSKQHKIPINQDSDLAGYDEDNTNDILTNETPENGSLHPDFRDFDEPEEI
jgi:putative transposase